MAVSLTHTTQAVGTDAGNGEIGKTQWNEEHTLTLGTGKLLGRSTAGTGAAEEITVGTGLSLSGGSLTATGSQNTFSTFAVAGQSDVVADSTSDTLTLAAGSNITITTNATTDTITIAASGGGTPGGSDTQIQFNDGGSAFGGDADLTWNKTTNALTVTSGSITMTGNISSAAWTTSGLRYKNVSATLTDTTSTGTVAAAYTNVYGGNTIAASNAATFTDYYTTFITQPTAGTNVTFTRRWALGLSGSISLTGQATLPLQTLTDGANVAWDCSSGAKAKVTLGGNRTMSAVTNAVEGTSYTLWVIQDGTGSRTLSWTTSGAGSFDFGTEGTPVLTTTASAADCLGFEAISIGGTLKLRFMGMKRGFA